MLNHRAKFLMWFLALMLVMACAPTLTSAPPIPPTLDPGGINRIIAQTADAASMQTVAAAPTSTSTKTAAPTKTSTSIPRGSGTPEPTGTNTLVLVFYTPTNVVLPPTAKGFTPTTNKDYLCEVLSKPANGEYYNPRVQFSVRWRLKNTGRRDWNKSMIDFIYDSGDKFHKVAGYDLKKDTGIGDVAEFFVEMQAPKDPGTYTTYWTMSTGVEKFCKVSLKINVVPLQ